MKGEPEIQVADAKQLFSRWNQSRIEKLTEILEGDIFRFIKLIPLFLQIENKLLPGYVGPDAPLGVYGYNPDKNIINDAKLLNSKFRYQQEGVVKNYSVESVLFQQEVIENKRYCWIFHRADLNAKNLTLLKDKINKISAWFISRGFKIEFICLSVEGFENKAPVAMGRTNCALSLEYFYSESILLAGKYPVWWLVPPSREKEYNVFVEHIKQARFVDNEEYIDLGSTANFVRSDVVSYAVELVQKIKQAPEICLVKILVADQKNNTYPQVDGFSDRLKKCLYEGNVSVEPEYILAQIMRDSFKYYKNHILSADRLFSHLKNTPGKLNTRIVDAFLDETYKAAVPVVSSVTGIDSIIAYLNFYKAVAYEVRQVFSNIVTIYHSQKDERKTDQALMDVTCNMQVFLSDNADRVPLYNNKNMADIILSRIQLKHKIINDVEDSWSLVLEVSEGNERTIEGFSSLLGLLAWCWLNRVVNNSTQVSIDCPAQLVKQVEAYYVLEVLIQQLDPDLLANIPAQAFKSPVRPLQSLLFLNSAIENINESASTRHDTDRVTHCEQLIINSWGDVYTNKYSGNSGVLQCLCEWLHSAPLNGLAKPQPILIFGYGAGDSTHMSQLVTQAYDEMLVFFYQAKNEGGRFILRMSSDYYVVSADNHLLMSYKIGNKKAFIEFLELPLTKFQSTALERLTFTEYPLSEIYQNNKKRVLQVFFQVINRRCHSWVIDEKGTLWTDVVDIYEHESYITHWLYFFKNIRNRLKKINYQDSEPPSLEINQISFNQLGGIEFYSLGAEAISGNKNFLDLQVSIASHENADQLSLVCDGKSFNYNELNQAVLIECVQYLSARMTGEGRQPVYVTDIDVPLRLYNVTDRDEIQISHILKFKRNFEHRINKLLDG